MYAILATIMIEHYDMRWDTVLGKKITEVMINIIVIVIRRDI